MKKQDGNLAAKNNEEPYFEVKREKELRCPYCRKLLSKGELAPGSCMEIKCTRCSRLCSYQAV
jgi:ferredoxin